MSEQCKGFVKATGKQCTIPVAGKVTPGYCIAHDPGITKEMRAGWASRGGKLGQLTLALIRAKTQLRTPEQIIIWLENHVNKFENRAPVITSEVLEIYAKVAKVLLVAIETKAKVEAADKPAAPVGWRASG